MKINVVAQLHHHKTGEPLWRNKSDNETLTLRDLCVGSLNGVYPNDPAMCGYENAIKRSYIADRIEEHDEVELTPQEIALVKRAVGANFPDPMLLRAVDNGLCGNPKGVAAEPVNEPAEAPKKKTKKKKA